MPEPTSPDATHSKRLTKGIAVIITVGVAALFAIGPGRNLGGSAAGNPIAGSKLAARQAAAAIPAAAARIARTFTGYGNAATPASPFGSGLVTGGSTTPTLPKVAASAVPKSEIALPGFDNPRPVSVAPGNIPVLGNPIDPSSPFSGGGAARPLPGPPSTLPTPFDAPFDPALSDSGPTAPPAGSVQAIAGQAGDIVVDAAPAAAPVAGAINDAISVVPVITLPAPAAGAVDAAVGQVSGAVDVVNDVVAPVAGPVAQVTQTVSTVPGGDPPPSRPGLGGP